MLQAQQTPALPYAKVLGRPGTGSYPAPSPDPTTPVIGNEKVVLYTFGMHRVPVMELTNEPPGCKC